MIAAAPPLPPNLLRRSQQQQQQQQQQQHRARAARAPPLRAMSAPAPGIARAGRRDFSSLSNYESIVEARRHYELDVDFDRRVIEGYARVTLEAVATGGLSEAVFDTRDLSIARVDLLLDDGGDDNVWGQQQQLDFSLGERHRALGAPLTVRLPRALAAGERVSVGIRFATSPESTALQFLEPEMTAGGKHPFLFSQAQAIHARSMVPSFDTPAVKAPYSASVRVPRGLTALMSAVAVEGGGGGGAGAGAGAGLPGVDGGDKEGGDGKKEVFRFEQRIPIPSYLIAVAVGDLASRDLSPTSRVWAEPSVADAAAYEFAETQSFLDAATEIAGEYRWGRYDLLLLPPSFPYGGMENPCLTFVTPTLLAGDRSLTNVVAHEIAHSFSGNLVTNASWESFWLNEGWTVYLERRIVGRLRGMPAMQFAASRGAAQLREEVARIGPDHNFTRLVPDLSSGEDPDDAFSRVPYEKGFYLLYHLQEMVGGAEAFDPFVRAYFDAFAQKSISTDDFVDFFVSYFGGGGDGDGDGPSSSAAAAAGSAAAGSAPPLRPGVAEAVRAFDWDAWLYAPGMPPAANEYDASLAAAADALAVRWHTADVLGVGGVQWPAEGGGGDIDGWSSDQVVAFLTKLSELRSMTPLHATTTRLMAGLYGFDAATNCEVKSEWLRLCLAAGDCAAVGPAVEFLGRVGRMKYLRPLYRTMAKSKSQAIRDAAQRAFGEFSQRYHPIARKMVASDLGVVVETE